MGMLEASASVRWSGWGGTVEGASGSLNSATATQIELGGPGGATNPEELLAAAHANCFTSTLTSLARSRGLTLDEVVTSVTTRLEWDAADGHRLAASDLHVRVASSADEGVLEELVREAELHCPVCRALAGNVALTVTAVVERTI
jgi:osmotically inducible protein OsmC